ncbi:MAG: ferrous iron transport protein B [Clostridium sp.]
MKIALTGNPNSGKTTLFNLLTGKSEKVGNWAGVTVDKKEGQLRKNLNNTNKDIKIIDLPGAYSMSPFTSEESVARDYIQNEKPDCIINIVDATNLSRSLFFTTQLLELKIPMVIALNKCDINKKLGTTIDIKELEKALGCKVCETVSVKGSENGVAKLIEVAAALENKAQDAPYEDEIKNPTSKEEGELNDKRRYEFVNKIVKRVEKRTKKSNNLTTQDKVDRVLAHKWLGLPFFALVMWGVFSISQSYLGPMIADVLVGLIDNFNGFVAGLLGEGISPVLSSILLDGIIGGVGAVLGFLPLIMILFFLIALLEDCGYMARIAVIMDRFFKRIGLSGKSIIPMIIGTGCSIPGIMSTRTIKDERQRRTTAMLTPFMPCGAKLPVIALFAGVFFNDSALVGTGMYFMGILLVIIGALIVVRITGEKNNKSYFIMELPQYKVPSLKRATLSMLSRGKAYVVKAGTIILVCNTVIQIMQTFNWNFEVVAEGAEKTSILGTLASPFAVALIPLGFGAWQLAAAAITGFIAKENVVGTLAVVYSITNFIDTEELALVSGSGHVADIMGLTSVAALSYLMFNLFTPPCFAAIGAMNSEMENKKWLWGGIGFQFATGYIVAFLVYQVGTLVTTGGLGNGFLPGLVVVSVLVSVIGYLMFKGNKKVKVKAGDKAWEMQ